jgi:AraC-like DNA-binding protein/tetratricopeptide (TPR) repeat protein
MENQQSVQEQYLANIKQIIADNIGNENFSVADLAREVGLSRSMLHRKLIRLTGKSATDLITEIRLTKAYELLEKDAGTVSEIAYRVGYSSPSYFNKVFKKTYKVSAGDVRRKGSGRISHLRVITESGVPGSARSKMSISNVITGRNISMIIIVTLGVVALILGLMNHVSLFSRLPAWTMNLILVMLIAGCITAIMLYWIYDIRQKSIDKTISIEESAALEKASPTSKRRLRISDVIIVVLILLVGILAYQRIFGSENLNNMTFPVRVLNDFGEWETHRVFKEDYITRLLLFPFENETTDSSLNWMGLGIRDAVFEDQRQFPSMLVGIWETSPLKEQIAIAREWKFPYFLTGAYRVDGSMYEITSRLYQTSNGAVLNEDTLRGADFFSLVDSISSQVRRDLGMLEIILETTPDLPISALITDHLSAYEHYLRGKYWMLFIEDAYANLNKAIELDSTFALAYYRLAYWCFNYEHNHLSAVKNINQARRHRNRLTDFSEIQTRILQYMINGDRESMIRLFERQVKIRPHDFNILWNLQLNYLRFLILDQAEVVGVKLNKLVPDYPFYQFFLAETYLVSGKLRKARKVLNKLLAESPENAGAMFMLGQTYLHDNKLEAAEQTFEDARSLMPDEEQSLSYFLNHLHFVKNTENMEEVLNLFCNTARWERCEATMLAFRIQNQLYHKLKHQPGSFCYPISDSVAFTAWYEADRFGFVRISLILSDQGKPVRSTSVPSWWIEDSMILRANDLLSEGPPQQALTAFMKAFEENPEHYYLDNYIQHLKLFTSPEYETLKSVFNAYAGSYEYPGASDYPGFSEWPGPYMDVKFEMEHDHFYFTNHQGLTFELLPLSEDTFMVPSIYMLTIRMVKENDVVTGLKYLYRDGREEFYPRIHEIALHN